MATDTKTLTVGTCSELLADIRNAGKAFFEKNVMIFAHQYVAGVDYTAGNNLAIHFVGAQEVLFFISKEILAATNSDLNAVESAYTSGTDVGRTLTTANTNASSLSVKIFAIVRV